MGLSIPPRLVQQYHAKIADLRGHGVTNEMGLRRAFQELLAEVASRAGWTLVPEHRLPNGTRPDGTLIDGNHFERGHWEAKDSKDDLDTEIRKKTERGYPRRNTIFEDGSRAVLYQDDVRVEQYDLTSEKAVTALLRQFLGHTSAEIEGFSRAVDEFTTRIPDLAASIMAGVETERRDNQRFVQRFAEFHQLCRDSVDPNIDAAAIEEMLVQHLLTERLFRTVFANPDFTRRNVIAAEIEGVIDALTSRSFSRDAYQQQTDHFYRVIEDRARAITEWSEKQAFLNTVYERFFQGFSRAKADTHGIVYTPQEIVDFMCASVDAVLQDTFGKTLSSPGVCILDPCVGTGNFIVNILGRIAPQDLRRKYREELFCNEIMLLPYYIASLNIEHRYWKLTGEYEPFEGICFADTLDMAEGPQMSLFTEKNTARVERQKAAEITVVIGNPPYNVGQRVESDNNRNRKYRRPLSRDGVDDRIEATYARDSSATLKMQLYDPYIRFFRWATDRLGRRDGIVAYVSNNSFVHQITFDGMRGHLQRDFDQILHLDLHGNVRRDPTLSGTTHNVFGIRVGVGITLAIRRSGGARHGIHYCHIPGTWRRSEKLAELSRVRSVADVAWTELAPDDRRNWLTTGLSGDFAGLVPIGSKAAKAAKQGSDGSVFRMYGGGVKTQRDLWVYDFDATIVGQRMAAFVSQYNAAKDAWARAERGIGVDDFSVDYPQVKWSTCLKVALQRGTSASFDTRHVRRALYRPFTRQALYFDRLFNDAVCRMFTTYPTPSTEGENVVIAVTDIGSEKPFMAMVTDRIADLHLVGAGASCQCFPLYTYNEDGTNRRDNITDWALAQFQAAHGAEVTKRDIFDYTYALLHHPVYRERYAENLKRELPRIPIVADTAAFGAFVAAGARLCELHLGYESVPEHPLTWQWTTGRPYSWRVEKMRLAKDKQSLKVNDSLTLLGIPERCFEYRLGNRSALEWVVDQYQVKTDKRSGIVSDPNRADDEEYIVRLVGRVIAVSLETLDVLAGLPPLPEPTDGPPAVS